VSETITPVRVRDGTDYHDGISVLSVRSRRLRWPQSLWSSGSALSNRRRGGPNHDVPAVGEGIHHVDGGRIVETGIVEDTVLLLRELGAPLTAAGLQLVQYGSRRFDTASRWSDIARQTLY
jgi:hypothetical protein